MDYLTYLTTYPHFYQAFSALTERTPNLLRYISEQGLLNQHDSFFSIGAGEADLEFSLQEKYQSRYELLEPAGLFVEKIYQTQRSRKIQSDDCTVHPIPFEEYVVKSKFDRVMAIHSWYSFGYSLPILEKALSMVKSGGSLFVNLMSKKSPVYGFSNMSSSRGIELCAEDLSAWARDNEFDHTLDWESAIRPKGLFLDNEGELTTQAKDFSCFLIAKPWDELSTQEHRMVAEIFQQHVQNDTIPIVSGCLLFYVD